MSTDFRVIGRRVVRNRRVPKPLIVEYAHKLYFEWERREENMAANLSKAIGMGSCINGHLNREESAMSDSQPGGEKVAILDAGAQYGKVNS